MQCDDEVDDRILTARREAAALDPDPALTSHHAANRIVIALPVATVVIGDPADERGKMAAAAAPPRQARERPRNGRAPPGERRSVCGAMRTSALAFIARHLRVGQSEGSLKPGLPDRQPDSTLATAPSQPGFHYTIIVYMVMV